VSLAVVFIQVLTKQPLLAVASDIAGIALRATIVWPKASDVTSTANEVAVLNFAPVLNLLTRPALAVASFVGVGKSYVPTKSTI
jgi:hypothetical protein